MQKYINIVWFQRNIYVHLVVQFLYILNNIGSSKRTRQYYNSHATPREPLSSF